MSVARSLSLRILIASFGALFLSLLASAAVFVLVSRPVDGSGTGLSLAGAGEFLRYGLVLVLAIAALLHWWLSRSITSPLHALSAAVERFGRGQLDVRAPGRRREDEIGDLGRAFDVMAARIQTLLAAERRLLQDISHELRSPLARLTVAVDLLRTAPDRDRAMRQLELDIARLTALVDSLVTATRQEENPAIMSTEPVDLWGILVGVGDSCAIEADARQCRLTVSASGGGGLLRGNPELLRRAFENVLRNAIRYAPEDSTVEVEMRGDRHAAIVTVRDYGPGVPAEDAALLGTPVFRVETARDAKTGGIGLGLAIARRAVLAHRGTLVAENAEPGLRIVIELPVELTGGSGLRTHDSGHRARGGDRAIAASREP